MLELALHRHGEAVQCRDIALRQEIPEAYLNQLLSALRRANLIVSRRGPGGGHQLARAPEAITLGLIVDALDGRGATPVSMDGASSPGCAGMLQEVWRDVDQTARGVVDRITLADLASRARERSLTYSI